MLVLREKNGMYGLYSYNANKATMNVVRTDADIDNIIKRAKEKKHENNKEEYENFKIIKNKFLLWKAYNEKIDKKNKYYLLNNEKLLTINEFRAEATGGEIINKLKEIDDYERKKYIDNVINPFSEVLKKKGNDIISLTTLGKPIRIDENRSYELTLIGDYNSLIYATDKRYYECNVENTAGIIDLEGVQCDYVNIYRNKGIKEIRLSKSTKYLILNSLGDEKIEELADIIKGENLESITIECDCEIENINMPEKIIYINDRLGYIERVNINKIKCKELFIRNDVTRLKEIKINIDKIETEKLITEKGIYSVEVNEIIAKVVAPSRWSSVYLDGTEKIKLYAKKVSVGILEIQGDQRIKIENGYIDVVRFNGKHYITSSMPIDINITSIGEGDVKEYVQYTSQRPDISGNKIFIYKNGKRADKSNTKRIKI